VIRVIRVLKDCTNFLITASETVTSPNVPIIDERYLLRGGVRANRVVRLIRVVRVVKEGD
jgi:hypothetical protein